MLLCACVISADISTVICDKVEKAQVLLENVERKETPGLSRIILMDAFDTALVEHGKGCGVHVHAMQEVEVYRKKDHYKVIKGLEGELAQCK